MPETLIYYCDESHIRGSNWFGIGGLAIPQSQISFVEGAIFALRVSNGYLTRDSEIQFKSAKKRRDNIYKSYIDLLESLIAEKRVHLHLRFTPADGKSVKPTDISKAFYSLLLHRAGRHFHAEHNIVIRPDNGCCTEYLPKMQLGLNNDIRRRFGANRSVIRDISQQDSRKAHPLQLLDVTLGALCSGRNQNHENGNLGEFKTQLVKYALNKYGLQEIENTPIGQKYMNIWNVTPR